MKKQIFILFILLTALTGCTKEQPVITHTTIPYDLITDEALIYYHAIDLDHMLFVKEDTTFVYTIHNKEQVTVSGLTKDNVPNIIDFDFDQETYIIEEPTQLTRYDFTGTALMNIPLSDDQLVWFYHDLWVLFDHTAKEVKVYNQEFTLTQTFSGLAHQTLTVDVPKIFIDVEENDGTSIYYLNEQSNMFETSNLHFSFGIANYVTVVDLGDQVLIGDRGTDTYYTYDGTSITEITYTVHTPSNIELIPGLTYLLSEEKTTTDVSYYAYDFNGNLLFSITKPIGGEDHFGYLSPEDESYTDIIPVDEVVYFQTTTYEGDIISSYDITALYDTFSAIYFYFDDNMMFLNNGTDGYIFKDSTISTVDSFLQPRHSSAYYAGGYAYYDNKILIINESLEFYELDNSELISLIIDPLTSRVYFQYNSIIIERTSTDGIITDIYNYDGELEYSGNFVSPADLLGIETISNTFSHDVKLFLNTEDNEVIVMSLVPFNQ